MPMPSDLATRQCSFWQAHFFGDGLDRRASRLLYAFKKGIPEGCVDNFSGHEGPLSAPVLGVESGHFDLRKGALDVAFEASYRQKFKPVVEEE